MLDKIKAFFEDHLAHDAGSGGGSRSAKGERAVQLASCALLLEMMRIDQESKLVEEQALRTAIQQTTQLDASAVDELIALAQAELDESVDYFQFTSLINEHFSPAQKLEVIEAMWLIAYSDHTIDAHERHLMRKISSLLYIQQGDHMAAKARARARAGVKG